MVLKKNTTTEKKDQKYKRQWQRQRKSRWCGKWNRKKNIFLCFPLKASSKFLHVSLLKLNDEKEGKIHLKPITSLFKNRGKAEAWHDCFEWTKKTVHILEASLKIVHIPEASLIETFSVFHCNWSSPTYMFLTLSLKLSVLKFHWKFNNPPSKCREFFFRFKTW